MTSPRGTGLLVPAAKTMAHLHVIHAALTREWPMTVGAARAEVNEAIGHLGDMVFPEDWISSTTINAINEWAQSIRDLPALITGDDAANLTDVTDLNAPALQDRIMGAWLIYNALDRELVGYTAAQATPGTTP